MNIVLTIKKTELEVGKWGYYRQGGARTGAWHKALNYIMT